MHTSLPKPKENPLSLSGFSNLSNSLLTLYIFGPGDLIPV